MNTCSVCLDEIKNGSEKIFSCNHKVHKKCYFDIVKRSNIFICCPECRSIDVNVSRDKEDYKNNILLLITNKNKDNSMKRCNCKNKDGFSCKNKAVLLNYGKCKTHNKNTLKEEELPLMEKYIYLILSQRNGWLSKIILFDIGKKLIIKYEIKELDDLLLKYYEFFSTILKEGEIFIKEYKKFYEYYGIEMPEKEWIINCSSKHILY